MMATKEEQLDLKVDVELLKEKTKVITDLCNKMDLVIEKLIDNHDNHIAKAYGLMEERRKESVQSFKEVHERIDTVIEKVQSIEVRLLEELKKVNEEIQNTLQQKDVQKDNKITKHKWFWVCVFVCISFIIEHSSDSQIGKVFRFVFRMAE